MQEFGLELLQRQDNLLRIQAQIDSVRIALLSSGHRDVKDLYPEWFENVEPPQPESETSDFESAQGPIDYSGVEYLSPDEMDEEDRAFLFSEIEGNAHVQVPSQNGRG